jgi:hypothetical protein
MLWLLGIAIVAYPRRKRTPGWKLSAVGSGHVGYSLDKMNRGGFFHRGLSDSRKTGAGSRELRPYSFFPLNEYFGGAAPPRCTPTVNRDARSEAPENRSAFAKVA